MPTAEVLTELEAHEYTVDDCYSELTSLVAGLKQRSTAYRDAHGFFRMRQFRALARLTDRMIQVGVEMTTWREVLAWACEEFADQPEIEKLLKYLYDR